MPLSWLRLNDMVNGGVVADTVRLALGGRWRIERCTSFATRPIMPSMSAVLPKAKHRYDVLAWTGTVNN